MVVFHTWSHINLSELVKYILIKGAMCPVNLVKPFKMFTASETINNA